MLPHLSFGENAAKEAFEEAGVIGRVSSTSVGVFRAKKSATDSLVDRIVEVWVYLLEVTETLPNWPEKGKRATRWATCEAAAQQLREPVQVIGWHRPRAPDHVDPSPPPNPVADVAFAATSACRGTGPAE